MQIHPVRTSTYHFDIPLSKKEKEENKKAVASGRPIAHSRIRGNFKFIGFAKNSKTVLMFQGPATVENGVIYAGRIVKISLADFDIGHDIGKIRGRVKTN